LEGELEAVAAEPLVAVLATDPEPPAQLGEAVLAAHRGLEKFFALLHS
jgi:hypothetical protein